MRYIYVSLASHGYETMTIVRLAAEAAVLFLVAASFGIAWNRQLIVDTWSGRATQTVEQRPAGEALPLPAGLLQVKEMFDRNEATFVDARDTETFAAGRIKGAVAVPVGDAKAAVARLKAGVPADRPLVVYCNGYGCHDSMTIGKQLLQAGYRSVFVFEGGYPEWQEAGYPVEGENP